MGTSVMQIDATYGHLVPDSEEYLRGLLDDYDRGSRRDSFTKCADPGRAVSSEPGGSA